MWLIVCILIVGFYYKLIRIMVLVFVRLRLMLLVFKEIKKVFFDFVLNVLVILWCLFVGVELVIL